MGLPISFGKKGFDEQWGCHYYYNTQTQESVWEAPAEGYVPWEEATGASGQATDDVGETSGLSSGTEAAQAQRGAAMQGALPNGRSGGGGGAAAVTMAGAADSASTPTATAAATPAPGGASKPAPRMLTEEDLLRAMGLLQDNGAVGSGVSASTAAIAAPNGDFTGAGGLRVLFPGPPASQQQSQHQTQPRVVPATALSEEQLLARMQGAATGTTAAAVGAPAADSAAAGPDEPRASGGADADPGRKVVTWTLEALEQQLEIMAAQVIEEAPDVGVGLSAAADATAAVEVKGLDAESRWQLRGKGPGKGREQQRQRKQQPGGGQELAEAAARLGAAEDGDDDAAFYDMFAPRGGGGGGGDKQVQGATAKLVIGSDDGTRRVTLDPSTAAYVRTLLPRNAAKYWMQRYSLFSRFDAGVQLDTEGWWSVTPEVLALHQAVRAKELAARGLVALDACCGCGGNVIQMATAFPLVMGVEISERRVQMARHNADVYGLAHKCQLVCADFFQVAPDLKVDVLFTSPPWGGPKYQHVHTFDVFYPLVGFNKSLAHLLGVTLDCVQQQDGVVAAFLPRNTDLSQLASCVPEGAVWEVERAYVNNKLKGITVYAHAGRPGSGQPNVRLEAEAEAMAARAAQPHAAAVDGGVAA
ncbi:hypothetical protein GPECTOR_41g693 [Gonium pectorale]|uniref:Trimethylguanosine synthase n=1 Tax=Gonium pectorale TaxID=33097 RepID=A0A150GA77_GONPE|nr:hypothetical protein GPECTOR_41g693 [Gonium pectorale]|eukprot:KXZ46728.1 hypothetical protein GPECTOR_41g693 [Gonium pectorale]